MTVRGRFFPDNIINIIVDFTNKMWPSWTAQKSTFNTNEFWQNNRWSPEYFLLSCPQIIFF